MRTAMPSKSDQLQKLAWYLNHRTHSAWDTFSPKQQSEMIDEDSTAGARVALLLGSLIATGLVLCVVALLAVWLSQ